MEMIRFLCCSRGMVNVKHGEWPVISVYNIPARPLIRYQLITQYIIKTRDRLNCNTCWLIHGNIEYVEYEYINSANS